jgi:hypothetical protein
MKPSTLAGLLATLPLVMSSIAQAAPLTWRVEGTIHNPTPLGGGEEGPSQASIDIANQFADGQHYVMDYVFDDTVLADLQYGSPDVAFPNALLSLNIRVLESGLSYSLPAYQQGNVGVTFTRSTAGTRVTDIYFTGSSGGELWLPSTTGHPTTLGFYATGPMLPMPDAPHSADLTLPAFSRLMAQAPSSTFRAAPLILGISDACGGFGLCAYATFSVDRFTTSAVPEAGASWMALAGLGGVWAAANLRRRRAAHSHQG